MVVRRSLPFFLGVSSSLAQILLLRELMVAFYGNELVFSVVLTGWLFGIGAGSFIGRFGTTRLELLRTVIVLSGVLVPVLVVVARCLREILGLAPGALVDIVPIAISSFVLVLPLSILYGWMFPAIALNSSEMAYQGVSAPSHVYAQEALGFVVGGLLSTFVLFPTFSNVTIAGAVFLLHIIVVLPFSRKPYSKASLLCFCFALLVFSQTPERIDMWTRSVQWKGFEVFASRDSAYGNVLLLERGGEKSLYENGLHIATTNDTYSSEESVHYALLSHAAPSQVLLIGGGASGAIKEVLKHPGVVLDQIELDPVVIGVIRHNMPEIDRIMDDRRVRVIFGDGRMFLKQQPVGSYDVIILDLSDPLALLINRYYTEEFFRIAAQALAPHGVLSFRVSSSENYLNEEGRYYLRTLKRTLEQVFSEVRSVPGGSHIFLASSHPGSISIDPEVLSQRLQKRGVQTDFVNANFFDERLSSFRVLKSEKMLKGYADVNTDDRPSSFLAAVVFWSTNFHTDLARVVDLFRKQGQWLFVFPYGILLLAFLFRKRGAGSSILLITVAGFTQMVYQIGVILLFQSVYGYAYVAIGAITAMFMLGVFLGATWAGRIWSRPSQVVRRVIAVSTVFSFALGTGVPLVQGIDQGSLLFLFFSVVLVGAGFLGGAQFSLACTLRKGRDDGGGILYATDVAAAALGALLAGIVLIPLWGFSTTAFFCGLLQLALIVAF